VQWGSDMSDIQQRVVDEIAHQSRGVGTGHIVALLSDLAAELERLRTALAPFAALPVGNADPGNGEDACFYIVEAWVTNGQFSADDVWQARSAIVGGDDE